MQIGDYVAAVVHRWLWVAAAAVVGGVLAVGLAQLASETWRSTTMLYVGASRADGAEGAAFAARVPDDVLPSLVGLARSAAVLDAASEDLGPQVPAGRLAGAVDVAIREDTSILELTVEGPTPDEAARRAEAVAVALERRTGELFGSDGNPLLTLTTVRSAEPPRFSSAPGTVRMGLLGLLGGAALCVVGSGLAERLRPRVRTRGDVARLTTAPVLAAVPVTAGKGDARTAELDRLRCLLPQLAAPGPGGRLFVTGPAGAPAALVRDVGPDRLGRDRVIVVPDARALLAEHAGPDDRVVVVVDGRTALRRAVRRMLSDLSQLPVPIAGIVVDGQLTAGPGTAAWWSAAFGGRTPWRAGDATRSEWDRAAASGVPSGTGLAAVAALVLVGLDRPLPMGTSTGLLAVTALLPLWIGTPARSRALASLSGLAALGIVSGLLLARSASADHEFARHEALATTFAVTTLLGAVGLLLWARTFLPLPVVAGAFGIGQLVEGALLSPGSANAVKYELALPLTVVVLAALSGRRRPAASIGVLVVLAALDFANDARSLAGFCVLTAVLVAWQARGAVRHDRVRWGRTVVALASGAFGAYWAFSELLLSGAVGAAVQARTAAQIAQSGSLLLGGRPEWTATWELMRSSPLGFGLGTVPSGSDVALVKEGMSVANIPTADGYIERYMMAGRFELHSVVADLWTNLGPAGLLLGLLMAGLVGTSLLQLLHRRQASALACFLALTGLWYLAFGPLPSDGLTVALSLGVLLPIRATAHEPEASRAPLPGTPALPPLPEPASA